MALKLRLPSAADILVALLIGLFLKAPISLASNAVTGWVDNAIGERLGLTSPSVAVVVEFLWQWILPFAAAALILVIYHYWNSRGERTVRKEEGDDSAQNKGESLRVFDEFIPDVRVADSPSAQRLFEGRDGDKLIPLLEAEKILAWARPMGPGEPAPIRISGKVWRTHQLWFVPKGDNPHMRNQTFIRTKARSKTAYYDVFLNFVQIKRVWPSFDPTFPVQSNVTVATKVTPTPHYNRAQLDRLVEAVDAFYPIVLDLGRELESGVGVAQSMEALILHNGSKRYLEQMDTLRLALNDALDRLRRAKEQQGLYQEVCEIVASSGNVSDPFYASWNELAGILRDIPEGLNARSLSIFVSGKKETFVALVSEFHQWAKQKKQELIDRRKLYISQAKESA